MIFCSVCGNGVCDENLQQGLPSIRLIGHYFVCSECEAVHGQTVERKALLYAELFSMPLWQLVSDRVYQIEGLKPTLPGNDVTQESGSCCFVCSHTFEDGEEKIGPQFLGENDYLCERCVELHRSEIERCEELSAQLAGIPIEFYQHGQLVDR